ncbi:MAG TPA: sugar ABC transporter ATP-binding protein, partial [Anaerolineales bacterium]|nr:sugar ABC transporter ATP-binding protein [Anaerolineales bacterium]
KVLSTEKRTTIFVTHNLKEAMQFGDRVAVIMDGELKQVGKPTELIQKPIHTQVKKFITSRK